MKTKVLLLTVMLTLSLHYSCKQSTISGEWSGKGIIFMVNETEDSILKLEIAIPHGDQFLAQWYESLEITNNKFSSYQAGNDFVGIPKRDLKGEFISANLARGTFNDVEWEATPKN